MSKNNNNTSNSNHLLEILLRSSTFKKVHDLTNSLAIINAFIEDLEDDIDDEGSVTFKNKDDISLLNTGLEKLTTNINRSRIMFYPNDEKNLISVTEFCSFLEDACLPELNAFNCKLITTCEDHELNSFIAKLFTTVQLCIFNFAAEDNIINFSLNKNQIIIESQIENNNEQLKLLLDSLNISNYFKIDLENKKTTIYLL